MFTSDDFKHNIEHKDQKTKEQRARELYRFFNIDYALPQKWVNRIAQVNRVQNIDDITCRFVWAYDKQSPFGFAAPLDLQACKYLKVLEGSD